MEKICCKCGRSVEGHTRFKDSRGYWCKDCHQADKAALGEAKCSVCGRTFAQERLIDIDGQKICATCDKERQQKMLANLRRQAKKATYWKSEWKRAQLWLIIAAVLILIILLRWWHVI